MKKALIGSGVAFVALVVIGGGAFYYFVYEPFLGDYVGGARQLAEVVQVNEQIQNQSSYQPPPGGKLTEAQVGRFMRVQQGVHKKMGGRLQQLEQRYEKLDHEPNREANYREVLRAWNDFSGLILDAKRMQVEALNAQGFSIEEYQWVRAAVYRAAGAPVPSATFEQMAGASQQNGPATAGSLALLADSSSLQAVPEKNQRLVAPFAETLKENAGLAWFGW